MKNLFTFILFTCFFVGNTFAQKIEEQFFRDADRFFSLFTENGLINYDGLDNSNLKELITAIEEADISSLDEITKKAFLINAYNLSVIKNVKKDYPITSVESSGDFFTQKNIIVAGKKYSLNQLEKEELLKIYKDPRLHFVLVCGALGCPPITDYAYHPDRLEKQLEKQTNRALNNPHFIKVNANKVSLSKIFEWYAGDFGGNKKAVFNFINGYRTNEIPEDSKLDYYAYDWSLNTLSKNSTSQLQSSNQSGINRYIVSSTIPKGGIEVKLFQNLYTQQTGTIEERTDRSTFFSSSLSFLYGLTNRFNLGFVTRYRRVKNDGLPSSPLNVFSSIDAATARQGFTNIGPQIRVAPFKALKNFSIQSSYVFPIGDSLTGSSTKPYIDWSGSTWTTQLFNDFPIGDHFSVFTEVDFILEDIGKSEDNHLNRFSTPATLIISYFPNNKIIFYAMSGYSPYWQETFSYFFQGGVGAKYQFSKNFELELIYTAFTNDFLKSIKGKASTYNLGLRYSL